VQNPWQQISEGIDFDNARRSIIGFNQHVEPGVQTVWETLDHRSLTHCQHAFPMLAHAPAEVSCVTLATKEL